MSRDLSEAIKQHRVGKRRSIREKAYAALVKKNRINWPKRDVYMPFLSMPREDLYENLINYRLSLDPANQRQEIAALTTITNRLPYPLVPKLIEYMQAKNSQSFKVPLAEFLSRDNVIKVMKMSREYLQKRKAKPAPGRLKQGIEKHRPALNSCVERYKSAAWVQFVLNEDVSVIEMVSRQRTADMVKDGWYRLSDDWYENVCKFGRSFIEDHIGYLLEDGRILVENRALFNAATTYGKFTGSEWDCMSQYLNAPWLDFSIAGGVFSMAARDTPTTRGWLGPEFPNAPGWYRLQEKWVKHVCTSGRAFIPNDIGYILNDGRVIPETRTIYDRCIAYLERMEKLAKAPPASRCQITSRVPAWVKSEGRSAIGVVAKNLPSTAEWIVPKPIPGTNWYPMKKTWYDHICKNGRQWQEGAFGYRFASGKILPETKQMFDEYIAMIGPQMTSAPTERHIETVKAALNRILPENEVDLLMDYIPTDNLDDFLDIVGRIIVFGRKLLTIPQIHLERLARGQYDMKVLPILTPSIMLPEIYVDPARDPALAKKGVLTWTDFDRIIATKINAVKDSIMVDSGVTTRRYQYSETPRLITVASVERKGPDTVYYAEDGVMYAFNRFDVLDELENPVTCKPFTEEFMEEIKLIRDPTNPMVEEEGEEERGAEEAVEEIGSESGVSTVGPKKREVTIVPNIFAKMRKAAYNFGGCSECKGAGYSFGSSCRKCMMFGEVCSECGAPVTDTRYTSVYKNNRVQFCSSKCFGDYRFRK